MYYMEKTQQPHKKLARRSETSKASWRIVHRPTGMPSILSMAVVTQRSPSRTKGALASKHWTILLQHHKQKHIKPDMQHQDTCLYKQYMDSKTMAESRYLAIWTWWLYSGVASKDAICKLYLSLAFWHFQYCQWDGFIQIVSPPSLVYVVLQIIYG
jgi:hypothetical protein